MHAHYSVEPSGRALTARSVRIVWPTRVGCYFVGRLFLCPERPRYRQISTRARPPLASYPFVPPPTTCRPALLLTSLRPGHLLPLLQATRPPPAPSPGHAPFRRAPPPGDVATAPFLLPASTLPEVEGDAADPAVQAEQISRGRGAGEATPPYPSTFLRGRRQSSWEGTYR